MYEMAVTFQIANNILTFSIAWPSKIYKIGTFGFRIYHVATLPQALFLKRDPLTK
jgi:hypothetical protein